MSESVTCRTMGGSEIGTVSRCDMTSIKSLQPGGNGQSRFCSFGSGADIAHEAA